MNSHATIECPAEEHPVESNLLSEYTAKYDAYFSSPQYALLAKPPFANLLKLGHKQLSNRVMESLRFACELGHKRPVVIGAIPFDTNNRPYLKLSTNTQSKLKTKRDAQRTNKEYLIDSTDEQPITVKSYPEAPEFMGAVESALALFESGELEKVVLSRTLNISSYAPFKVSRIVQRLENVNNAGYTFAVNLKTDKQYSQKNHPTLVGASPELLISVRNGKIFANPLAGSEPRCHNEKENQRLAQQLMQSGKDRREHKLVVDEVVKILTPFCRSLNVPLQPSVITTPTMLHLSTEIEGELINNSISSIEVALALHPTPAVCGYPHELAREAIEKLETHDRDAFAGMVGWCDAKGNGDWAVTIRCAKIQGNEMTLYAGAGVVAGSCPEKEWKETGAKFKTILDALGF